jgi:hypothetical protein
MAVLKSKRKQSRLEVFHHAYKLRREMTDLLMRDFGYKEPSFDKTMREEKKTKILNLHKWFIEDERVYIITIIREMMKNITLANSIYPTTLSECDQRRSYQNLAIGLANDIKQELQYVIDVLPVNVEKYIYYSDELDNQITLLKEWRKSDNKIRKRILDKLNK